MLSYEEFKDRIRDDILDYLPDEYSECEVTIVSTLKNNEKNLDGLMIKKNGCNIAPNIYLNDFYEFYEDGMELESVLKHIARIRVDSDIGKNIDPTMLMDFGFVKDHIYLSVVNYELNKVYLSCRPHRRFLDLAIVYYISISECGIFDPDFGRMVMIITNDLTDIYDISEEELFDIAKANTGRTDRYMIRDLGSMFGEENCNMFVLTNNEMLKGASLMLCEDVLKKISDERGTGLYILPSSVDEVLILPFDQGLNEDQLIDLVYEANSEVRGSDKYLSDNVYFFDPSLSKVGLVKSSVCRN
ncbi:MAG: DUF5688 family protein [Clostridiales bacterium]|nr:DUF5688 family protein [Clostridiales bacterium]